MRLFRTNYESDWYRGFAISVAALVAVVIHVYCCDIAKADGGRLQRTQSFGSHRVSVFTSPNPVRVGAVDISVLVQDNRTSKPVTEVQTLISLDQIGEADPPILAVATSEAATNKLLQAATVELPAPGKWGVTVQCISPEVKAEDSAAAVRFELEVAPPLPQWLTVWPWFSWPLLAVVLFVVHRKLVSAATH